MKHEDVGVFPSGNTLETYCSLASFIHTEYIMLTCVSYTGNRGKNNSM